MRTYLITYATAEWPRFVTCLRGNEATVKRFVQQVRADGGQLLEVRIMEACV